MKKILNKISTLISLAILMALCITIYNIAFATEENQGQLNNVGNIQADSVSGIVYGDTVVATYSHAGDPITDIDALIDTLNDPNVWAEDILCNYPSVFCVRHHQALPKYKALLERDHENDVEVSDYIDFEYGSTPTISQSKFSDYKQKGDLEDRVTKSNIQWKAFPTDMKTVSTSYGTHTSNVFAYGAAFSEKLQYLGGSYGSERAQQAIWGVVGAWYEGEEEAYKSTPLYRAGKALDEYESQDDAHGHTPSITVQPNAGTILLGSNNSDYQYKIGPFKMGDYAYAYSTDAENLSGGLMGGLVAGKLILNDGTEIAIDGSSCKIEYTDYGDNSRSGTYFSTPADYKFPWPNSTFYIVVSRSLCGDATTLSEIGLTYQSTRAEGSGWVCQSQYVETTWKRVDSKDTPSHTYSCEVSLDGHSCSGSSTSHNSGNARTCTAHCTSSKNYCSHGIWNGHHTDTCDKCTCDGKDVKRSHTASCPTPCSRDHGWKCTCSHEYCDTGYCSTPKNDGDHGSHTSTYECSHDHTWCRSFNWEANMKVQWAQPLLAVNSANVYVEQTETIIPIDVRLTTDISIDKYIIKAEHVAEAGVIYGENDDRANQAISTKNANSVKVERGDRVTFKIVLTNNQDEEAKVKIRDILPKNKGYKFDPTIGDWLVVPGNGSITIKVEVITDDITGTANNTALIITRNQGNKDPNVSVDYPKTIDRDGPVVNVAELNGGKLEDADYYTIKQYDVSLDKSIVQVEHTSNGEVTYSGNGRKNIDESSKENSPVYAEYGDKVTYEIDIYNTTAPYTPDRKAEPHWEPDKAYVDVQDTLPKKYTDLTVAVSNGTGNISIQNGKFTIDDIMVPAGGKTTITVTLVVNEHDRTVVEENTIKIINDVKNINKCVIRNNPIKDATKNNPTKGETSDYYHINDYDMSLVKYISEYNPIVTIDNNNKYFTQEENIITDRSGMSEAEKAQRPLNVEKTETIVYSIRLDNNSKTEQKGLPSGVKRATSVRPTTITDTLQIGLEYRSVYAKVYTTGNNDKYNTNIPVTTKDVGNNTYEFTIPNTLGNGTMIILEPGEYIIYYVTVEITESNMYLYSLKNTAALTISTNINNTDSVPRVIQNDDYNENIAPKQDSSDYVKLKDLVIAGKVWLDTDKDGFIGQSASGTLSGYIDAAANISTHFEPPTGNSEYAMKNIVVKLYRVGETDPIRITRTDENGLFTFGKREDGSWYSGTYSYDGTVRESEQRIDKATNKNANKNYQSNSTLIEYYIEYEYDGLVYKSTVYAGKENLNNDGSFKTDKYKIDSNAAEFKAVRDEFDLDYEVIGFDKGYNADLSTEDVLSYQKEGHNSWIKQNDDRVMTARSFIKDVNDMNSTEYLWLFKQASDYSKPETEYLKYINLGLEEREDVDISITHDVYEVKTTVNGEQMTYEYNQNDYTLGNAKIDKAQDATLSGQYDSEFYMTGYRDDNSVLTPYEFRIYNADYNYKKEQYSIQTVEDYKGIESELNIETTYRIKVTNNGITEDEPYSKTGEKDIKVYTGINEIVQYYDTEFVDLEFENGAVKTFNIKTKDANGYLVNTKLDVVKAEYVMKDGTRKEVELSDTSKYNAGRELKDKDGNALYSTLYIRPKVTNGVLPLTGDIILAEGESVDILITFNVDKEADRNVHLGDKINVAEISAYSTYYKNENGAYYAAGLVDRDSNPGNFGELYSLSADKNVDSQEYLALFEDDTFKTGISMLLQDLEKERLLRGFVWDDSRSEVAETEAGTYEDGKQYIGDGKYDVTVNAEERQPNAKRNQSVSNKEVTDIAIKDMKTQLIEMVAIPERDASGNVISEKVYEQTISVNTDSIMSTRTNAEGKYELKGYIPGEYIVRFFYGDDVNLENMLIFNGQDYKSTTYQVDEPTYAENITDPDQALAVLEKPTISDAKDDEIRRLETISYSETMTNNLNNILRGKNSSNKNALIQNTHMNGDTAEFLVKAEKELSSKKILSFKETMEKFQNTERHPIVNIDFGIEYRPELQVALNKYISNVKIVTSDENSENTATPLLDAIFKEYYGIVVKTDYDSGATEFLEDANGNIVKVSRFATNAEVETAINAVGEDKEKCARTEDGSYVITLAGTELDAEKSIGLSNLQYVRNEYDRDTDGKLFLYDSNGYVKATQGFVYLNIDDQIMQGATISIKYVFAGSNLSEIDRVNSNLSVLRFKENDETQAYTVDGKYYNDIAFQRGENTGYIDIDYSGAMTARNKLFSEYYRYELVDDNTAAKKDKNGNDILYRVKDKKLVVESLDTEYYGRYLGQLYYTGKIGPKDIVAELKIDKILDYVDNDLVFDNSENNGENNLWKTTTSQELYDSQLISEATFTDISQAGTAGELLSGKYILDSKNRTYDTAERSNLAILLDDRIKDYANPADDITVNKEISKYLLPRYSQGAYSYGTVKLVASKVISPEELSEDMNYENIGEIVQYSSVTGRVTTLATTLGNVNFKDDEDGNPTTEWDESLKESDTAATEEVTLTPPTGLGKVDRIIRNTVEGASYTVIIIIAIAVVCVGVLAGIKIYRKRRIK